MRNITIALAVSLLFHVSARCADTLSIVFTGDILLDRGVRRVINHHGVDHLFSDGIDSVFRSAQVVVGNLECPATKIKAPVFKQFIFRATPIVEPGSVITLKMNQDKIDDRNRKMEEPKTKVDIESVAAKTLSSVTSIISVIILSRNLLRTTN